MLLTDNLPPDYVPFERLILCGNTLINCRVPIKMKGQPPFLVGKGQRLAPWVWLSMPTNKDIEGWIELVERNISTNRRIVVTSPSENSVVIATTADPIQPVLAATRDSEEQATIHKLDLRHVGLRVYGDKNGLVLATNTFIGNTFENADTMLSIDG